MKSSKRIWLALLPALLGGGLWLAWSLGTSESSAGLELGADLSEVEDARQAGELRPAEELSDAPAQSTTPERVEAAPASVEVSPEGPALEEQAWTLRGRVFDPLGAAAGEALVGFVSLHEGRPGNRGDRHTVQADASGRFSVEAPEWARDKRALLFARRKGWRPYSLIVQVDAALVETEQALTLGHGHELSGRVVRNGRPVVGANIFLDVAYGIGGIFDAGSESWWADGHLEEKHAHAQTDADGSFSITGMGRYEHRVQIDAPGGSMPAIGGHLYAVLAPDHRVYDLSGARLSISVLGPAGAVEDADINVSCEGSGVGLKSELQAVAVGVPASKAVSIEVRHPTSRPVTVEVQAPELGQQLEVFVPLEIVSRPSMTVRVPGASAAGVTNIKLRMQQLRGFSDTELEVTRGDSPDIFEVALVPLDPAGYQLILEPHDRGAAGKYLTPRTQEVELPAEGNVFVEFELSLSGRLDVNITTTREGDWSATYRVRNEQGGQLLERSIFRSSSLIEDDEFGSIVFEEFEFDSFFYHGSKFSRVEDATRIAGRCGVLPAGAYTLEVESEGHEKWSGPLAIRAGETTKVDVQLVAAN